MTILCKILFKGEIEEGFNKGEVIKNLADILGVDASKAPVLFTGRTVSLAKDLNEEEMLKKASQFMAIGLKIDIKKEVFDSTQTSTQESFSKEELTKKISSVGKKIFNKETLKSFTEQAEKIKDASVNFSKRSSSEVPSNDTDENLPKNASDKKSINWQNKYFSIVTSFSFFVATIAIISSITFSSSTLMGHLNSSKIEESSGLPTYEDLKGSLEQKELSRYEPADAEYDTSDSEAKIKNEINRKDYIEKINSYFIDVEKNINSYAKILSQQSVKEYGSERLKDNIQRYNEFGYKYYQADKYEVWKSIIQFTDNMSNDAGDVSELKDGDYRKQEWEVTISWFLDKYEQKVQNHQKEQQNIDEETVRLKQESSEALLYALYSFAIFMVFTLILTLLRIEKNTRGDSLTTR
ncbi:hypothetical protein [Colwellia hornerae]|uniref:Uncharacterized protein n=1 Tax=Colwellia hornerae TaxID=89402 RepID=A0A5C6QQ69_9GAMM|nr:hypothetical protein [Colwellia hornerae]TWX55784.1 hypothetical protein ESZ28_06350 [Colwellia hornerae]TWX61994.1 hypothetical protein ESZ26_05125 [Colwellia hornerae]TWX71326.1 hypothetical protein ESZ27_02705 [Colwellia hornerae]